MLFYLNIARSKKKRIIENLEKIHRRNKTGKASLHVLQYLERGLLSIDEVSDILGKYRESPQAIFDLLKELRIEGSDDIDRVAKENIDTLMAIPVKREIMTIFPVLIYGMDGRKRFMLAHVMTMKRHFWMDFFRGQMLILSCQYFLSINVVY
jgi:hypothetical protein